MVKHSMDLLELLGKRGMDGDVDFLREALRVLVDGIMDAEVSAQIGAQHGERSPERVTYRNRTWDTRAPWSCTFPSCGKAATSPGWNRGGAARKPCWPSSSKPTLRQAQDRRRRRVHSAGGRSDGGTFPSCGKAATGSPACWKVVAAAQREQPSSEDGATGGLPAVADRWTPQGSGLAGMPAEPAIPSGPATRVGHGLTQACPLGPPRRWTIYQHLSRPRPTGPKWGGRRAGHPGLRGIPQREIAPEPVVGAPARQSARAGAGRAARRILGWPPGRSTSALRRCGAGPGWTQKLAPSRGRSDGAWTAGGPCQVAWPAEGQQGGQEHDTTSAAGEPTGRCHQGLEDQGPGSNWTKWWRVSWVGPWTVVYPYVWLDGLTQQVREGGASSTSAWWWRRGSMPKGSVRSWVWTWGQRGRRLLAGLPAVADRSGPQRGGTGNLRCSPGAEERHRRGVHWGQLAALPHPLHGQPAHPSAQACPTWCGHHGAHHLPATVSCRGPRPTGPNGGTTPGALSPGGRTAGGRRAGHPGLHGLPSGPLAEAVVQQPAGTAEPGDKAPQSLPPKGDVVGIIPNRLSARRLVGAVLAEQHDEWAEARRYLTIPNAAGNEALPEPNMLDAAA